VVRQGRRALPREPVQVLRRADEQALRRAAREAAA
jgi:hypothetical protein